MKKEHIWRGGIYVVGILILALGIVLTTKTGLGISPITSLPFAISTASGLPMPARWRCSFSSAVKITASRICCSCP